MTKNTWKKLANIHWSYLLWWWIPMVVSFFLELASGKFAVWRLLNLLENHFFALLLIGFALLIQPKRLSYFFLHLNFLLFTSFIFAETLYFNWFGTNFSASSIFVLFETNEAEASEFLDFYINFFSIALVISFFLYGVTYITYFVKNKLQLTSIFAKKTHIFLIISCLIFLRITKLIDQNFPYLVVRGVVEYQMEHKKLENLSIDENYGEFKNVVHTSTQPSTYVLLIGESTTKHNFELYGYPRPTNPRLTKRKNELYVFEDAISTNAFTIGALKNVLSLHNFTKETESTIIQLFNHAGFETHWISNQRPIGPYESIVTKISRAADYYTFTNTAIAGKKTPLDEVLLPLFKKTLERKAEKKLIVLHLLGTHLQYKDRYPSSFDVFSEMPPNMPYMHEEAMEKRNEYDNAVLYTDFMINQVIEELEAIDGESFVLYFSDHGEEVYLDQDFAGHNEDNPTPSMFEVPLIVWANEEFKASFTGVFKPTNPYSFKDFIHSFAELSKIQFEGLDYSKSIFSEKYSATTRTVKGDIEFEKWKSQFFKNNK